MGLFSIFPSLFCGHSLSDLNLPALNFTCHGWPHILEGRKWMQLKGGEGRIMTLFSIERDEIIFLKMSFPFRCRRLLDSPVCPLIIQGHRTSRKKLFSGMIVKPELSGII